MTSSIVPHAPQAEHLPTQRVARRPHLAHTARDLVFGIVGTITGPCDNNLPIRRKRRELEGNPCADAESAGLKGDATVRHDDSDGSDYLGALLGDERRLVLVPLDPDRPWTAFRRMRAWMKRAPKPKASMELFRASVGGELKTGDAKVIPLRWTDAER